MNIKAALVIGILASCACALPHAGAQVFVDESNQKGMVPGSSPGEVLSRQLLQLKAERDDAAARYAKDDPRVKSVEERLVAAQSQVTRTNAANALATTAETATPVQFTPTFPRIVEPIIVPELAVATTNGGTTPPTVTATPPADPTTEDSAEDKAALALLANTPVSLNTDHTNLETVLKSLQEQTRANLNISWQALQTAGIDRNSPVTLTVNNASFGKVLSAVLNQVGGGTANLSYAVDGDMIVIATRDDLSSTKYQTLRVYPVKDFVQAQSLAQYPWNVQELVYQDRMNKLMDTIKATIAPDSWRDAGGTIGSIRDLNGVLIINQTSDNQRAIAQFLALLRAKGAAN